MLYGAECWAKEKHEEAKAHTDKCARVERCAELLKMIELGIGTVGATYE